MSVLIKGTNLNCGLEAGALILKSASHSISKKNSKKKATMTKKKSKAGAVKLEDPQTSERLLGGAFI